MLKDYCNQTATWDQCLSVNEYNEPSYSTTLIEARVDDIIRIVRDRTGTQVTSNTTVICLTQVGYQDRINGRQIVAILPVKDLEGVIHGYEVLLQ